VRPCSPLAEESGPVFYIKLKGSYRAFQSTFHAFEKNKQDKAIKSRSCDTHLHQIYLNDMTSYTTCSLARTHICI
jgi:hypothetical protein